MLSKIAIQNFKAIRSAEVSFSPSRIDVVIGPNNTGKTSFLQAVALPAMLGSLPVTLPSSLRLADAVIQPSEGASIKADYVLGDDDRLTGSVQIHRAEESPVVATYSRMLPGEHKARQSETHLEFSPSTGLEPSVRIGDPYLTSGLPHPHFYRFVPSQLKKPTMLLVNRSLPEEHGLGLAATLEHLHRNDRDLFNRIATELTTIFPEIDSIKLPWRPNPQDASRLPDVSIVFVTRTALEIPASQASDGLILVLALLTVTIAAGNKVQLLIEEPENGLHPLRILEVASLLKKVVQNQPDLQIIMTTHSPLFIDEFEPDQVIVSGFDESGGVRFDRVSDAARLREALNVLSLGEIWVHEGESRLVKG